jgi:hypothetical protein
MHCLTRLPGVLGRQQRGPAGPGDALQLPWPGGQPGLEVWASIGHTCSVQVRSGEPMAGPWGESKVRHRGKLMLFTVQVLGLQSRHQGTICDQVQ